MINFGEEEDRLMKQYNLINVLSQGGARSNGYELDEKWANRFDLAITERDDKSEVARKKYLRKEFGKGAAIAAGFAGAGYAIRNYFGDDIEQFAAKNYKGAKSYFLNLIGGDKTEIAQPEVKTFSISSLPEEIKDTELVEKPLAGAEKAPVESLKAEAKTVGVEDASTQEPPKGAPKEVVGEFEETVKKEEPKPGFET